LNIEDEITVEAWMKPLDSSYMRTTSGFDAQFAYNPDVLNVDNNIFVIVGEGKPKGGTPSGSGIVATLIIEEDGTIIEIEKDNPLVIDTPGAQPDIIKISEDNFWNYYALAYNGGAKNSYAGYLKIIKINKTDGSIDGVFKDKPKTTFNQPGCWPDMAHVDNNIYAITYSDIFKMDEIKNGNIFLKTIDLDINSGALTTLSTVKIDNNCNQPDIIKVSDTIYAVAYKKSNAGYVSTVYIDPSTGLITLEESMKFDSVCNYPDITHINDNVFTVVYGGHKDAGHITTFTIDIAKGTISSPLHNQIFDSDAGFNPNIIQMQGDLYSIVYSTGTGGNPDGKIVKLRISPDGMTINDIEQIVNQFYDPVNDLTYRCFTPIFVRISEYVYAAVYRSGIPHEGLVSSFKLLEDPTPYYQRGVFKSGSVNLYANQDGVYASIKLIDQLTIDESEHQLHLGGIIADNWYHIALTFDGSVINLYCHDDNGNLISSTTLPIIGTKRIKIAQSDYMFGSLFFGYLDEIAIHSFALSIDDIGYHASTPGFFEDEP
jgi:hypothetical protein